MYKLITQILTEIAQRVPQVDEKGNVLYYFCGSPVAALFEINCKSEYLGIDSVDSKNITVTRKGPFFKYPKRPYHDLDLVTTNTATKDYFPPFFTPSVKAWERLFKPRRAFIEGRVVNGIKTDNLYQWAGFFDIVKLTNQYTEKPLYVLTPESLFAYKVFEVCYAEKHLKDIQYMWETKTLSFNIQLAKEIMSRNVTFYSSLVEFSTLAYFIQKYKLDYDAAGSPLLEILDKKSLSSKFHNVNNLSEKYQKEKYSKIDKKFLENYLSEFSHKF